LIYYLHGVGTVVLLGYPEMSMELNNDTTLTISLSIEFDDTITIKHSKQFGFAGWKWVIEIHKNTNTNNVGIFLVSMKPFWTPVKVQDMIFKFDISTLGFSRATSWCTYKFCDNNKGRGFGSVIIPTKVLTRYTITATLKHVKSYGLEDALLNDFTSIKRVDQTNYNDLMNRLNVFIGLSLGMSSTINEITEYSRKLTSLKKEQTDMLNQLNIEIGEFQEYKVKYTDYVNNTTELIKLAEHMYSDETKKKKNEYVTVAKQDIVIVEKYIQLINSKLVDMSAINLIVPTFNADTEAKVQAVYHEQMSKLHKNYQLYCDELEKLSTLVNSITTIHKNHIETLIVSCKKQINSDVKEANNIHSLCQVYALELGDTYNDMLHHTPYEICDTPSYILDPNDLVCSITTALLTDPVIAADGHTYDRPAITEWLKTNDRSPLTNEKLTNKTLIPNRKMVSIIKTGCL
jgi:hypothetical protein